MKRENRSLKLKAPRGTRDLLPEDMYLLRYIEDKLRGVFERFGYAEVQTPIFELFELFALRSGDEIRNSMFVFETGEGEMALRPELTAPICRLVAEGKIDVMTKPIKLYYIGRAFRYEEPQAGRYREFWQAGIELIGPRHPEADAEVVSLACISLEELDLKYNLELGDVAVLRGYMTSKGVDYEVQNKVLSALDHLRSRLRKLEVYSELLLKENDAHLLSEVKRFLYPIELRKRRLRAKVEENIPKELIERLEPDSRIYKLEELRVDEVREILKRNTEDLKLMEIISWCYEGLRTSMGTLKLPPDVGFKLLEALKLKSIRAHEVLEDAKEVFKESEEALREIERLNELIEYLDDLNVKSYVLDLGLARGLEYYTGIVFEIHVMGLGAQSQVCGGGRYDRLIAEFGGPDIPSVGFAFGLDRLMLALKMKEIYPKPSVPMVYVAPISDDLRGAALKIAAMLRNAGIACEVELMRRRIRRALSFANKRGFPFVILIAPREYQSGSVIIKDMMCGTQELVSIKDVTDYLRSRK
ncbi:MAG: histidine--tRNA ligase family protein [Thermoprotei archaeon]|nr:histidine--tRNA ligase family protein [Thermoprotei archaeon]